MEPDCDKGGGDSKDEEGTRGDRLVRRKQGNRERREGGEVG